MMSKRAPTRRRYHKGLSYFDFASLFTLNFYSRFVTVDLFQTEMAEAFKMYDKYVICIHKTPDEFQAALASLIQKAIAAYENRGPDLRHGIALDKFVTVILSQSDGP